MNLHAPLSPSPIRQPPAPGFSPFGTARQRFLGRAPYEGADDGLSPLLEQLQAAAQRHDLGAESVYLAWELAQWQPDLEPQERAALLLLILASLLTLRRGSTRFPVHGPAGQQYLHDILAPLLLSEEPQPAPVVDLPGLIARMRCLLDANKAPCIIGGPQDYKPLLFVPPYLYHQKLWQQEERVVQRLVALLSRPYFRCNPEHLAEALATVRQHAPVVGGTTLALSAEQEYAVLTAVHCPFTIISGGPGTGKTSIVVFILRLLMHLGVSPHAMALAAPTGKAAQRLGSSMHQTLRQIPHPHAYDTELLHTCPTPQTLHRLLGYAPGPDRFYYHENNRLASQVVIVDEGSMIDLFLMERLLRAVRDDVRLIVLGDAEQLPSVDTGAVLRDLVPELVQTQTPWRFLVHGQMQDAGAGPNDGPMARCAVRLRHSYRMRSDDPAGRNLLTIAAHINAGQVEALFTPTDLWSECIAPRSAVTELTFSKAEHLAASTTAAALDPFLERWYAELVCGTPEVARLTQMLYHYGEDGFNQDDRDRLTRLFQHTERSRILCLTRVHATGAEAINARLHARCLQHTGLAQLPEFFPGEPVMMLHNDYDKRLFNGDQGLILRVAMQTSEPQSMAVFPVAGDFAAFHLTSLRGQIVLAFALTVHKSQGSEFDHVALILPETDLPLLTREMLYTAVTRSKRSVTIVGRQELFEQGVRRTIRRFSGIAEKVQQACVPQ